VRIPTQRQWPVSDRVSWVVGRGGLLGRGVEAVLARRGPVWHPSEEFKWDDPSTLAAQMARACRSFSDVVGEGAWQIAWCAGAAVVRTGPSELHAEMKALGQLLDGLRVLGECRPDGSLFVSSSAGGVYAGSSGAPYSESSPVRPISPYGQTKLEQEELARQWSKETHIPVLIGRISNLYGPGQNLSKGQGLVTQLCAKVLTRQPVILYMPLDTIRDYVYVTDAAALVADGLRRLRAVAGGVAGTSQKMETPVVVKILASHQPSTIGMVLHQVRRVTRRPVHVVVARSPQAAYQVPDLRMASEVWPELDQRPLTSLGEGIHRVISDLLSRTNLAGRGSFRPGGGLEGA